MSPLEVLARAISPYLRNEADMFDAARSGLLALAMRDLPRDHIKAGSQAIDWGGELCEDAGVLFSAICRSIATEGKENE